MSDEIRSNAQEFISFLGTCMFFYEHHLTPHEQSSKMYDMGIMLRDYLSPNNRKKLISVLQYGQDQTDVNAIREAYHTGQTHAVMRGGDTDGKDDI